jgi:DtxR family Mn-dependent transcriptional regulator
MTSSSEERYLLSIYKQHNEVADNLSTNLLAESLGLKAASVTEMLNKLHNKGLISYTKNKGASLTNLGRMIALKVLRKQLLWDFFLINKINLSREETSHVSSLMRHINSAELIEKLNSFLENPLYGVSGEPIPKEDGNMDHAFGIVLHTASIGFKGKVVGLKDNTSAFLEFLKRRNIFLNTKIEVLEICLFDQSFEVSINDMPNSINISHKIADNIIVA